MPVAVRSFAGTKSDMQGLNLYEQGGSFITVLRAKQGKEPCPILRKRFDIRHDGGDYHGLHLSR